MDPNQYLKYYRITWEKRGGKEIEEGKRMQNINCISNSNSMHCLVIFISVIYIRMVGCVCTCIRIENALLTWLT